jgi:hypothetical protein
MTAAQRLSIQTALGRDVLQLAEEIQFCLNTYRKCDAALWRRFLEALLKGAGGEVMGSPLGLTMQLAILGRIQNATNDANERRTKSPGGGFPNSRRQF